MCEFNNLRRGLEGGFGGSIIICLWYAEAMPRNNDTRVAFAVGFLVLYLLLLAYGTLRMSAG